MAEPVKIVVVVQGGMVVSVSSAGVPLSVLVVDFDAQDMEEGDEGVVFIPADGAYTEAGLAKVDSVEPGKLGPEEIALLEPFWEN